MVSSVVAFSRLRNFEPECLPPVLKGEYEHYAILGIKESGDGNLELQVQTTYPGAEVAQSRIAEKDGGTWMFPPSLKKQSRRIRPAYALESLP
jgi:hypothetical protein